MMLHAIVPVVLAVALDQAAIKEIEEFRKKHEEDYRRQYVTLAGLFALNDGVNTIGSAPASDIKLSASAPANVGRLIVSDTAVRFEPQPGANVRLEDRAVTAPIELKSDEKGPADELSVGGVSWWVHMSGDRRTIRIRDVNGAPAKAFAGFTWFPIDGKYRVVGRFIKDPSPATVKIPNQLGDEETYTTEGI